PRRQGGPLDAHSANIKRQSAQPQTLKRLEQSGTPEAVMTLRSEDQMVRQADAEKRQKARRFARCGKVGVARARDARGAIVREQYLRRARVERGAPAARRHEAAPVAIAIGAFEAKQSV